MEPALVAAIAARPGSGRDAAGAVVPIAAVAPDGRLVGLVELRGHHAKSVLNFPPDEPAAPTAVTETAVTETAVAERAVPVTGLAASVADPNEDR